MRKANRKMVLHRETLHSLEAAKGGLVAAPHFTLGDSCLPECRASYTCVVECSTITQQLTCHC